ncbi:hypothetical protein F4827_000721 [Paraburkholderia bannensis]|uniref:Uncharacterized protein n=1 Tax=Paraburkholderia bannensis TaxID=765414 RepID=A0A7W9TV15_9BURK|nr:hypothetical protein [Paraburkholderia sp. WP4_3_2]MBB6100895.1 hypothetical protein [Paraburkholderia bannensis]
MLRVFGPVSHVNDAGLDYWYQWLPCRKVKIGLENRQYARAEVGAPVRLISALFRTNSVRNKKGLKRFALSP